MYHAFEVLLEDALEAAVACGDLSIGERPVCRLEPVVDPVYGDATCRVAMVVARRLGRPALDVARLLVRHVDDRAGWLERVDAAGPGFVNVTASLEFWRAALAAGVEGPAAVAPQRGRALVVASRPATARLPGRVGLLSDCLQRLLGAAGWAVERVEEPIDALAAVREASAVTRVVALHDADETGVARRAKDAFAAAGGSAGVVTALAVAPLVVRARGRAVDPVSWGPILVRPSARLAIAATSSVVPAVIEVERLEPDRIDNPWVGVHYALARITRVSGLLAPACATAGSPEGLGEVERECLRGVGSYADAVTTAARRLEVEAVVTHALRLAAAFHRYYNRGRFLDIPADLAAPRAVLAHGIAKVLTATLEVVGASGAERG